MSVRRGWWVGLFLASLARTALAQPHYDAGNEHYEQARLPNGLRVYLAEDHRSPLAAIEIRYPIGDLRDPAEAPGAAQLVGKLLPDLKTSHLPQGAGDLIAAAGFYPWNVKAVVREDDTSLKLVVPAAAVDLALFIEAERMGFAADGLTTQGMVSASHELLEKFGNQTGGAGTVGFATALAYGPQSPLARLNAQPNYSKVDWHWLHRRLGLYNVSVATLSMVGDFDSKRLLPVIARLFGTLKGAALPAPPAPAPASGTRQAELRAVDVTPASIWSWRTPRYLTPDDIALDVVARYLRHRLSQKLGGSDERSNVTARQMSLQGASVFWLYLPSAKESEQAAVDQAARAEIDALAAGQVDVGELELARAAIITEIATSFDSLQARAHTLGSYGLDSGKLDRFDEHLKSYAAVDAARLSDVVRRLLKQPDGTLRVVPDASATPRRLTGIQPPTSDGLPAQDVPASADAPVWFRPPTAVIQARFDMPRIVEGNVGKTRLLFMPRAGLPTINVRVALNWRGHAPAAGSRQLLLRTLLRMHPGAKPALKDRMADLGAQLETQQNEDVLALSATTLVERADSVVAALRETLEQEHVEQAAFDAAREELVSGLAAASPDTAALASRWFERALYRKDHRYQTDRVDEATRVTALKSLTSKQLEAFWKSERRAEHVTVSIVGPIDEARAEELARLGTPRFRVGPSSSEAAVRIAPRTLLIDAPLAKEVRVRFNWPVTAWGTPGFVDGIGLRWVIAKGEPSVLAQILEENGVKNLQGWAGDSFVERDDTSVTLTAVVPKTEVVGLFKSVNAFVGRLQQGDISWHAEQEARRASVQWVTRYLDDASECLGFLSVHTDLEVPKQSGEDIYVLAQRMSRASLAKAASVLAPEKATVIVYGPVADLAPSLQGLGFAPTSVLFTAEGAKAP